MPDISDGSEYRVTPPHLSFLEIDLEDAWAFSKRERPLGMRQAQFETFLATMHEALRREDLQGCDIRLKGSSAEFFSSVYKPMLWSRVDVAQEFMDSRGRVPLTAELDSITESFAQTWPASRPRPKRRPFDSLFRAGIHREPSDYDLQISSSEIASRVRAVVQMLDLPTTDAVVNSRTYGFFKKALVLEACPTLSRWAIVQSDALGRNVSIAAFDEGGPLAAEDPARSSHHRDSDWRLS